MMSQTGFRYIQVNLHDRQKTGSGTYGPEQEQKAHGSYIGKAEIMRNLDIVQVKIASSRSPQVEI